MNRSILILMRYLLIGFSGCLTANSSDPVFITVNQPPEGDKPTVVQFTPDGGRFVISHLASKNLIVFDAATRQIESIITLSGSPQGMALAADNIHAVTANYYEGTASIVNVALGKEVSTVPVGGLPAVVRITPDSSIAVVGNTQDDSLSVIDIASATVLREIPGIDFFKWGGFGDDVGIRFTSFEIAPDNQTLVFPDLRGDQIGFIDISNGSKEFINSDSSPSAIAISDDGTIGLVNHRRTAGLISVLDLSTRTITRTIPIGDVSPGNIYTPIAINSMKTQALAADGSGVRVVDLTTDFVSEKIFTGSTYDVDFSFDDTYGIVCNFTGTIIDVASGTVLNNVMENTPPGLLAVSPVGPRAVLVHHSHSEEVNVINTQGATGFLEGTVSSGPEPEGDKAYRVAITRDGTRAVTVNYVSQNASVIDLDLHEVISMAPIGVRPDGVAISPDGGTAVITSLDSTFASVLDLNTSLSTDVTVPFRSSLVTISPDGQYAYFIVVANGDGVERLRLDTLQIDGPRVPTVDMGNWVDLTLSHDGAFLITTGALTDNISIVDTVTWNEVARLPVGNFPVRVAFSPNDSAAYVTNRADDTVSVVTLAGDISSVGATIPVGNSPLDLVVHPEGDRLYVGNSDDSTVSVVDLSINAVVSTIGIIYRPHSLAIRPDGRELYVVSEAGELHVIDTETDMSVKFIDTNRRTTDMAYSEERGCLVLAQPEGDDGITFVCPSEFLLEQSFE